MISLVEKSLSDCGFEITPDPDQPGLWQWVQRRGGVVIDGCEISFASREQALEDMTSSVLGEAARPFHVSDAEWEHLGDSERASLISSAFAPRYPLECRP